MKRTIKEKDSNKESNFENNRREIKISLREVGEKFGKKKPITRLSVYMCYGETDTRVQEPENQTKITFFLKAIYFWVKSISGSCDEFSNRHFGMLYCACASESGGDLLSFGM